jgi:hypothetical protein
MPSKYARTSSTGEIFLEDILGAVCEMDHLTISGVMVPSFWDNRLNVCKRLCFPIHRNCSRLSDVLLPAQIHGRELLNHTVIYANIVLVKFGFKKLPGFHHMLSFV